MMFQGGSTSTTKSKNSCGLTADNLEVAEILFSLPRLIYSTIRWARKKKRSVIKSVTKSNTSSTRRILTPAQPETPKIEPKASSPTSHLVDSDEKFNPVTKTIRIRKDWQKIEELREKVAALEKNKKLFAQEVEKVRAYRKKLIAEQNRLLGLLPSTSEEEQHFTRLHFPTTLLGTFMPFVVGSPHPNNFTLIETAGFNRSAGEARRRRIHILREKRKWISSSVSLKKALSRF